MKTQQIQILWVEADHKSHNNVIDDLRQTANFHIETVTEAHQALESLNDRPHNYDVVLLGDLSPLESETTNVFPSLKFLAEIKELNSDFEVIMFTSQDQDFELEALEAGVFYYFHSPLDAKKLMAVIERLAKYNQAELLTQANKRTRALETLHKISLNLTSSQHTSELVRLIVEEGKNLLQCKGCGLYLLDESSQRAELVSASPIERYRVGMTVDINAKSVVGQVIQTTEPFFVGDYRNWADRLSEYDEYEFTAVAGAPVSWDDQIWGVITVRDTTENRVFDDEALRLLESLGNLAAIALENAKRLDEVLLGGAIDAIVVANEKDKVINVNRQAEALFGYNLAEALQKDISEFYYEDAEARRIKRLLVNSEDGRISDRTDAKNKDGEKIPSQLNASLLYDFEGKQAGSVGFFRDQRKIEKARKRIRQLNRLLEAEQAMTVQYTLPEVVNAVVTKSAEALEDVDAAVLYLYDQDKQQFLVPPTVTGVMKTKLIEQPLPKDSVVHKLMSHGEPHFANNAVTDLIMGGDFVIRESIISSAGIPLQVKLKTVGFMFFNYRQTHRFDEEEKNIINTFANRAAIAIDNVLRYQREKKRADVLRALYHAGQIVSSTLDLGEILDHIAEQAWQLIGLQGAKAHIASLRLVEGSTIKVVAVTSRHEIFSQEQQKMLGVEVNIKKGRQGRIGIMGRTINTGRPQRVDDVRSDPDYLPFHPETRSEMVVPIVFGYVTFGVISIQSTEFAAFDEEDEQTLVSLADQAAIAIQNAQAFGEAQAQADQQTAISPFVITGPTTSNMFFGRQEELQLLLAEARNISFALIGGRRIGKSSLLTRLHRVNLPIAGYRSLYHDCATTPTYQDFLNAMLYSWRPDPPVNAPRTFAELIQSPPSNRPLVLLFDEADKLIPEDKKAGWPIFNHLRALANVNQVQVILSGERTLRDALKDAESPLFNFAKELLIGPMDASAVQQLISQPIEQMDIELISKPAIVDRIYNFTSGHPNIVQRLCNRLVESAWVQKNRQVRLEDVNEIIDDINFQQNDFLGTYWEAATPLEKIISLLMADNQTVRTLQTVRQALTDRCQLNPKISEIDYALQSLVDLRSILKRTKTQYKFAVEAFPRVVVKVATLDDMLDILVEDYEER